MGTLKKLNGSVLLYVIYVHIYFVHIYICLYISDGIIIFIVYEYLYTI